MNFLLLCPEHIHVFIFIFLIKKNKQVCLVCQCMNEKREKKEIVYNDPLFKKIVFMCAARQFELNATMMLHLHKR